MINRIVFFNYRGTTGRYWRSSSLPTTRSTWQRPSWTPSMAVKIPIGVLRWSTNFDMHRYVKYHSTMRILAYSCLSTARGPLSSTVVDAVNRGRLFRNLLSVLHWPVNTILINNLIARFQKIHKNGSTPSSAIVLKYLDNFFYSN